MNQFMKQSSLKQLSNYMDSTYQWNIRNWQTRFHG